MRSHGWRRTLTATIAVGMLGCLAPVPSDEYLPPALEPWAPTRRAFVVAAGDLASDSYGDSEVGALMSDLAFNGFLILGDNAYPDGSTASYSNYWAPVFGRYDSRAFPAPGNHDYETPGAQGYMSYFNLAAPNYPRNASYYVFELGGWRWFSLNSEIPADSNSAQYAWLRTQLSLADLPGCIGAYWHRPIYSVGEYGDSIMRPIWSLLAAHGADVVLTAHDHNYQRWKPINGMTQFVVGTGGRFRYPISKEDSLIAVADGDNYGVLQLALWEGGADFRFVTTGRSIRDSGFVTCY
jgi:acid phosphatase type 7